MGWVDGYEALINFTLLFSVNSYVEASWTYIRGLEKLVAPGEDISKISSVASLFLSRIDSNVDKRIDKNLKQGVDDINLEAKLMAEGQSGQWKQQFQG